MTIHSLFPAGAIITNGLGANANSGALITAAKWSLLGCTAAIIIPTTSSGGGSRPMGPGEIQNFYTPVVQQVDNTFNDYVPINLESKIKNVVKVKININGIENEKEFILKAKPYKLIIKVINIINITDKIIKITINNIKNKMHNISTKIKNIKVLKD